MQSQEENLINLIDGYVEKGDCKDNIFRYKLSKFVISFKYC